MRIKQTLLTAAVVMWVCAFVCVGRAEAAYLFLDPDSATLGAGEILTVKLKIDTEQEKVQAAEAWINYSADELELIDIQEPQEAEKFFGSNLVQKSTSSLIYIANWIVLGSEAISSQPGKDGMAVLRFKAVKAGTYALDIKCIEGDKRDSTIAVRKNNQNLDIINCEKVKDGTYTITAVGGGGGTTAPTSSISPTSVLTRTPTSRLTLTPLPTRTPTTSARTTLTPTVTPSRTPTPTASPTPTQTTTTTPGAGGTAITTAPSATSSATPTALPATGAVETTATVIGIGILLTVVSIVIKVFVL